MLKERTKCASRSMGCIATFETHRFAMLLRMRPEEN
jgi:hypothetical protein